MVVDDNSSYLLFNNFNVKMFESVSDRKENDVIVYSAMVVIDRIISAHETRTIIFENPHIFLINI